MMRIAFGDARDKRVVDSAVTLARRGVVRPVLFAQDPTTDLPDGVERVLVAPDRDALEFMAEYVSAGHADAGIAGSLTSSATVIRAAIRRLGDGRLATGCFIVEHAGTFVTYADCSVIPNPTAVQLADIAEAAADHHRLVTGEVPRVAMLSFSTSGSAVHPSVQKVRTATDTLQRRRPELMVDGEMQFDVAVDPAVGERKMPGSQVAGRANVLIFPTLEAGNIAYKVAERVGGARALGSFLLNLTKPWVDLSRGCSAQDIVDTALILAEPKSAFRTPPTKRNHEALRTGYSLEQGETHVV